MENQQSATPLIYSRMIKCMQEVKAIKKDQTNKQQGFKYRGIDDIANELHDIFAQNSIFIIPKIIENTRTEHQTKGGSNLFYVIAKINYKFITEDGSYVECEVIGEAMDSGDKATNKAMSVALKYALIQILLIPTNDDKDPDAESHDIKSSARPIQKSVPKPTLNEKAKINAIAQMEACKTIDEVKACWSNWKAMQSDSDFIKVKDEKKISLNTIPA